MPAPTDGDVAVISPRYVIEEAYRDGYNRFEDGETVPHEEADLAPFHDSATYANTILPNLRCMSGYADGGHGTYQQHRQVAAIKPGAEEDEPAEADLVDASTVFEKATEAWNAGAYDGLTGEPFDVPELWV